MFNLAGPTFLSHPSSNENVPAIPSNFTQAADPENNITGSWVLIGAASEDEAIELLAQDPFTVRGVWDFGKRMMWCVRSGLRVEFVKKSVEKAMEMEKEAGRETTDEEK